MKPRVKNFAVFIGGAVVAWCLIAITQPATGERRDDHADAVSLGVSYHFGEEARSRAEVAGLMIPRSATDVFYCIGGLKPVVEFIAFTLPSREVWPLLTSLSGKKKTDVHELPYFEGPELFGGNHGTLLFNTTGSASKVGIEWKIKEHLQAACVINEASGRVFIFISPTE